MRLLIVRHAIAMERADYQAQVRAQVKNGDVVGSSAGAATEGASKGAAEIDTESDGNAVDDSRPLTILGIRKMRRNAKGLKKLVDAPEFLFTSPLIRAAQTADILAGVWRNAETDSSDLLRPGLNPEKLVAWLKSRRVADSRQSLIALVGHEPDLSRLAGWFLSGTFTSFIDLKKGGACLIDFNKGLGEGRGKLLWLATPSILRAVGR